MCELLPLLDFRPIVERAVLRTALVIFTMPMFLPNPMFHLLLESSHRDDSNKWSNIEFGEGIT